MSASGARVHARALPGNPGDNQLLAGLAPDEVERLLPHLHVARVPLGETLYESGGVLRHAFFPTTAIVSLIYVLESGVSGELAGVGNEGVVGVSLLLGGGTTPSAAVVQSAGFGYRLEAGVMKDEFNRGGHFQRLLLRYTQALMTQLSQTAICNRGHTLDQKLCRWLLSTLDRLPTNDLVMTQELLANTIGVRREGVTEAAQRLRQAGIIRYRRGHISVLAREGLEERVCECYGVVKKELGRLLSDVRQP